MWNPNASLQNHVNTGLYPLPLLQFKQRESEMHPVPQAAASALITSSKAHLIENGFPHILLFEPLNNPGGTL